jgi:hypothetical protein
VNRQLARTISTCLRFSQTSSVPEAKLCSFTADDWRKTLGWLDLSGLALYFFHRIQEDKCQDALPPQILRRLKKNQADNNERIANAIQELSQVNSALQSAGIKYAVLKGFSLVPDYCPDASLRTQYDHDYLIKPGSLSLAEEALRSVGYRRKHSRVTHPIVFLPPAGATASALRIGNLYAACIPRPLEVHFGLWNEAADKIDVVLPKDFLERTTTHQSCGIAFPTLDDEDTLLFQVLHAFRHMLHNWCRLSVFLEIAHILNRRAANRVFWNRYTERIAAIRWLPEISGVVFSIARDVFGAPVQVSIIPNTTVWLTPAMRLWIRMYGRDLALENFASNKFTLFLHREFICKPSTWREVQRLRLFPIHEARQLRQKIAPGSGTRRTLTADQVMHILRRLQHHLGSLLRYAWECPRWFYQLRLIRAKPTTNERSRGLLITQAIPTEPCGE